MKHTSRAGAGNGIFPEEAFSNKRILPGPPPRLAMSDEWSKRSQVTPASFDLMVRYFIAAADRSSGRARKLDKTTLEAGASMSALVLSVVRELKATTPLPDSLLNDIVAAFVAGDPTLEVELQCASAEKAATWQPGQIPTITDLIREHGAQTGDTRLPEAVENVRIQAGQLAAEEFALSEKKVDHDMRLVKAWALKVRDRESQLYYQRLHHKEARASKAHTAAVDLFTPGNRNVHFHSLQTDGQPSNKVFGSLTATLEAISNKYRIVGAKAPAISDMSSPPPIPPLRGSPPGPLQCGRLRGSCSVAAFAARVCHSPVAAARWLASCS